MLEGMSASLFFFDRQDHELLHLVNHILERDRRQQDAQLFAPELHPHGIKELSTSSEMRIAYAVINLLDSLELGAATDRIMALRSLHEEVLATSNTDFRRNTGRVLIQIMKDLVRAYGNPEKQLRLARDFRAAARGRRRVVRAMLKRYHLLEMPEAWDQLTFDNHVHDANTKGRKSPTHLIMDAWIKGVRSLTVIYYNFVEARAVDELLQAASIMGIAIRIGMEFRSRYRGRYIEFIWEPVGIDDPQTLKDFLNEDAVREFLEEGRAASAYNSRHIFSMLDRYNEVHRHDIGNSFGVRLPEIPKKDFLAFVASGQPSLLHLAELVYKELFPAMTARIPRLREEHAEGSKERKAEIEELVRRMRTLHPEFIMETWFTLQKNPELHDPEIVRDDPELPPLLRLSAPELISRISEIRPFSRITLTLSGLKPEEVLEIVYLGEGKITHLELFNLKDYAAGKMPYCEQINEMQFAINQQNAVDLKRIIRGYIRDCCGSAALETEDQAEALTGILRNIPKLLALYRHKPLKTRVGSDSTSRSYRLFGLGFAFVETLPRTSRQKIHDPRDSMRQAIPLYCDIESRYTYVPRRRQLDAEAEAFNEGIRRIPGLHFFGYTKTHDWVVRTATTRYRVNGSIATLGGFQREAPDTMTLEPKTEEHMKKPGVRYLNTRTANLLKVLAGFSLATATFLYTQDWWVLAWFGAVIWFAITGIRNIIQAVLGGGGFRRTPLLRWNEYVNWTRICDSLLFTGISVPLLELLLRWFVLGKLFGITALTNPLLFFTLISAANGLYIASHNIYRGLPKEAVIGNLFRSVLAVPVSLLYSAVMIFLVKALEIEGGLLLVQQGAAIISKAASDTVAGIIEGFGDQAANMRLRYLDYTDKLRRLFSCFSRLEVLLPEEDVLDLMQKPRELMHARGAEVTELGKAILIHALDLMYFWMYQPRARTMLVRLLRSLTPEEKTILYRTQLMLTREREVSQLFVDGISGQNFAKPLAFFLDRHREYLADMERVTGVNAVRNTF